MSRIAKYPVKLPDGVEVTIEGREVTVKGPKGSDTLSLHETVEVRQEDGALRVEPVNGDPNHYPMAGTMRSLLNNMVVGVTEGFERRLELVGVGYRAQAEGNKLSLTLGYSHPVEYQLPEGVTVETPKQTQIVVRGTDKQSVGQVAAKIRGFRPPEPYKGKGLKYADERILRKEAKKK